ncbi:MAG: hypothetical protein ABIG66_02835 [Candidatus Kerfeldbacteria bacterium]
MTRGQLQRLYPDTYAFFKDVDDEHPFWVAIDRVDWNDARDGKTILPQLEQVFASLLPVDRDNVLKDQLEDLATHEELMDILTRLYVAYLYRRHGTRMVNEKHGYDLEIEMADQLLAMGIVKLQNFKSLKRQFAMQAMTDQDGKPEESTEEFLNHLKEHAKTLGEHHKADQQVLAAITGHAKLEKEAALAARVEQSPQEMEESFPHIAGVVLIDPAGESEKVRYVPFHGHEGELEQLLERLG